MEPFWERVFWLFLVSGLAAIGWLAKSILKPWSDAALMRSKAFVDMVEVLQESVPHMSKKLDVLENASMRSNDALAVNTSATEKLTETIERKMGSDPDSLCKLAMFLRENGQPITPEEMKLLIAYRAQRKEKEETE